MAPQQGTLCLKYQETLKTENKQHLSLSINHILLKCTISSHLSTEATCLMVY